MKKIAVAATIILLMGALVSIAYSYGGGRGHGRGPCGGEGPMGALSQLNLSADQTAKINALRDAHLKEIKPLLDRQFSKRGDLRLLWMQENPDQSRITVAQKEIRDLRGQIEDKITAFRLEVLKLLTPEQRNKLTSRHSRWDSCPDGGGPGMGGGMMGGPGPRW